MSVTVCMQVRMRGSKRNHQAQRLGDYFDGGGVSGEGCGNVESHPPSDQAGNDDSDVRR